MSVSPVSIIPQMLHTHSFIFHLHCIMFFSQYLFSPVNIIPPMLHTHSFIYHPHCIIFFSQYVNFPGQYHSTNAPYSFIHLPLALYKVFLTVHTFPCIIPPLLHTHSWISHWHYTVLAANSDTVCPTRY